MCVRKASLTEATQNTLGPTQSTLGLNQSTLGSSQSTLGRDLGYFGWLVCTAWLNHTLCTGWQGAERFGQCSGLVWAGCTSVWVALGRSGLLWLQPRPLWLRPRVLWVGPRVLWLQSRVLWFRPRVLWSGPRVFWEGGIQCLAEFQLTRWFAGRGHVFTMFWVVLVCLHLNLARSGSIWFTLAPIQSTLGRSQSTLGWSQSTLGRTQSTLGLTQSALGGSWSALEGV